MALTRYQIPQDYTPAYNEQHILYLSDQIALPNFKYIVVIQVNGVDSYQRDVYPRPDGFLEIDTKEIVSNFVSTYFNPDILFYRGFTDVASVIVDITESISATTPDTDNFSYLAFNACLKKKDFNDFSYKDWYKTNILDYTSEAIFMNELYTDINVDSLITLNTDYWLTYIQGLSTYITISVYDDADIKIAEEDIDTSALDSDYMVRVNIGAKNVGILTGLTIQNGYTIEAIINSTVGGFATAYAFKINNVCTKYDVYRLYFLKRNGAIGYKTFEKVSELKVDKKVNEVRLNPSNVYSDGMGGYLYGYPKDKHFSNVVSTNSIYSLTLNTDWITESQSIKLEELFDSPKVWLQDDKDGSMVAVNIKENSLTFKQHANEQLFNYNVTVELSQQETRQRGI